MAIANIKQENRYTIKIGDKTYTDFEFKGEWEGMMKFQGTKPNEANLTVIVSSENDGFMSIFDKVFGLKTMESKPTDFVIVKASSSMLGSDD